MEKSAFFSILSGLSKFDLYNKDCFSVELLCYLDDIGGTEIFAYYRRTDEIVKRGLTVYLRALNFIRSL